jgi:uncharacterized membrane protein
VLRGGVLASSVLVAVGGLLYLTQNHANPVDYSTFHMERSSLRTLSGILRSAMQLQPSAVIQLGLLSLIATPIARVTLAALGFYLDGDRLYVGVSLIVLAILIFSITHAL